MLVSYLARQRWDDYNSPMRASAVAAIFFALAAAPVVADSCVYSSPSGDELQLMTDFIEDDFNVRFRPAGLPEQLCLWMRSAEGTGTRIECSDFSDFAAFSAGEMTLRGVSWTCRP